MKNVFEFVLADDFEFVKGDAKKKNILEFVLKFYRDVAFGCYEYCDKTDDYSEYMYWIYFEKRRDYREMLTALGFTWDAINDLDTRLAMEYARTHA